MHIGAYSVGKFTSTQEDNLGRKWTDESGRVFQYVKYVDAVTYVQGHTLTWSDADAYEVTNDESGGTDRAAGVVPYDANNTDVPAENYYGYMQIDGVHPRVKKTAGDDSWAEGDYIIVHATTDGMADQATTAAAPTAAEKARGLGWAVGASNDTADYVPVSLAIGK